MAVARGAGNRCFRLLSSSRAHTTTPYNTALLWETLRALKSPGRARTVILGQPQGLLERAAVDREGVELALAGSNEKGIRLAQNMQVGPCITVGMQL